MGVVPPFSVLTILIFLSVFHYFSFCSHVGKLNFNKWLHTFVVLRKYHASHLECFHASLCQQDSLWYPLWQQKNKLRLSAISQLSMKEYERILWASLISLHNNKGTNKKCTVKKSCIYVSSYNVWWENRMHYWINCSW